MTSKTSAFFKVLINRFHPGINQSFFKSLPSEDTKEAYAEPTSSQDTSLAFSWPYLLVSRTHYSWLMPHIEKLPKQIQNPVICALPDPQFKGISKLLKLPLSRAEITPNMKAFLIGQLYQQWQPREAIPLEYLPPSHLNPLLELSKAELVDLIDLLAIYDLAEAIRHIVDKKNLKAIYLCLSPQKQQFLRLCLHKKEKLAASKLDISKWDGTQTHLATILHHRGMLRFGKALCGQSRNFLWLLTHLLDTGRGAVVAQYYQEDQIPGVTSLLAQQLINALNFLKPKNTA